MSQATATQWRNRSGYVATHPKGAVTYGSGTTLDAYPRWQDTIEILREIGSDDRFATLDIVELLGLDA
jgi:hypothetical protein